MDQFIMFYNQNSVLFVLLTIWSTIWKGIALWKAAQKKSIAWFIPLLVINVFGVLEILYIFIFSKQGEKKEVDTTTQKPNE